VKSSAFEAQRIPHSKQNLATFVPHMEQYRTPNWAIGLDPLRKIRRINLEVYTKLSKQLGKQLVVVLEEIVSI
jgi:hypothetical protein